MQPLATFQEPLELTGTGDPVNDVTYILTTGFQDAPFPVFHPRARAKGWKTRTVSCGHDVVLDLPEELTSALIAVADARAAAG